MKEAFGGLSSDWKEGINWAAMRPWRLNRAREAIKRYGLGALLLMYDEKVGGRAEACGVEPARARPRRAGAARAGPGSRRDRPRGGRRGTRHGGCRHPGALLSGWSTGETLLVAPGGAGAGHTPAVPGGAAAQVTDLARRAAALLNHDTIEWALADGTVHLLQSSRASAPQPARDGQPRSPAGCASVAPPRWPGMPSARCATSVYMRP